MIPTSLVLWLSGATFAGLPTHSVQLGGLAGVEIDAEGWDLSSSADNRYTPSLLNADLGVRFGGSIAYWVTLEGELGWLPYAGEPDGGFNHALSLRGGALANVIPNWGDWIPFVSVGGGVFANVAGSHGNDVDARWDWGIGVRGRVWDALLLRVDLRHVITDGQGPYRLASNVELLLSADVLVWRSEAEGSGSGDSTREDAASTEARCAQGGGARPGCPDPDGDGVTGPGEACPEQAGLAALSGCPDRDGDGVADRDDACPDLAGAAQTRGCTDQDGDGVPDPDDACPALAGLAPLQGCADQDGDGVSDPNDACPAQAGLPALVGCADQDGDGVSDPNDACPTEPGDVALGGCLDPDGDRVVGAAERCPNEAEDVDGYDDGDGCPDADNDGDGLIDGLDRCPNEPELKNGFEDEDGCPEADADQDGIIDARDKCQNEPETYNGNKDDDGCPDGAQTIEVTATAIKILEVIRFGRGTAAIDRRSFKLLDTVATALLQYPQVTKLSVEGHTDDVGVPAKNLALSKDRAAAVRLYLIKKGVAADRLVSDGFGSERPVCQSLNGAAPQALSPAEAEKCRTENRRVEFRIVELHGKPVEHAADGTPKSDAN